MYKGKLIVKAVAQPSITQRLVGTLSETLVKVLETPKEERVKVLKDIADKAISSIEKTVR